MSGQVSLLVADDSEICLLRGKPLKEHSIEDIRKELKKRRLNDKGTKSDLIKRLEDNILGQKCSPHWTRSQNRSKVVVHDHLTAIDPRGKQCFHCGIKKVLPYILPKDGMIYHFCSAECRFSNQIPNHGGHGENSKSQNDNPTFFGAEENGQGPAPPMWPGAAGCALPRPERPDPRPPMRGAARPPTAPPMLLGEAAKPPSPAMGAPPSRRQAF